MLKRLRPAFLVVAAVSLVLTCSMAAEAFTPTYAIKVCTRTRIRPKRFTIARRCYADSGIYARKSVWRYWDRKRLGDRWAKAITKIYQDNCVPTCASGHYHHRRAKVWLTGRDLCRSVHGYVYKVQHIKYTGPEKGIGPDVARWPHGWHVLRCPPPPP